MLGSHTLPTYGGRCAKVRYVDSIHRGVNTRGRGQCMKVSHQRAPCYRASSTTRKIPSASIFVGKISSLHSVSKMGTREKRLKFMFAFISFPVLGVEMMKSLGRTENTRQSAKSKPKPKISSSLCHRLPSFHLALDQEEKFRILNYGLPSIIPSTTRNCPSGWGLAKRLASEEQAEEVAPNVPWAVGVPHEAYGHPKSPLHRWRLPRCWCPSRRWKRRNEHQHPHLASAFQAEAGRQTGSAAVP